VTSSGDIYTASTNPINGQVDKWTLNSTTGIPIFHSCIHCWDVFIDINDTLYCSLDLLNEVITKPLNSPSNTFTIVAGTGSQGSASNMLNSPNGLFVNSNFDLYVADCSNDRIQLFPSGQLNAITVAGNGSLSPTIALNLPIGVVLDADNYLYIVEHNGNRIVGSGPNGFQCLVGCTGTPGPASNQLSNPWSLSFDSYGNIFVTDQGNSRIQKFILITTLCGKYNKIQIYIKIIPRN
jgi:hypothetical protein